MQSYPVSLLLRRSTVMLAVVLPVWLVVSTCFGQADQGSLTLAAPIADHMVLQHGKSTGVWGVAKPGASVTIEFAGQTQTSKADQNGNWIAKLSPLKVSAEPQSMTVKSGDETLSVKDILVGEVWMCSGQSNMAWTLDRTETPNYDEANLPLVRFFNTATKTAETPQRDCTGTWQPMNSETAKKFSGVGYYFGRKLHMETKVPVGLVNTAWGGKPVEAFTSYKKLKTVDHALPLLDEWKQTAGNYNAEAAKKRFDKQLADWQAKTKKLRAKMKETGEKVKLPRRPRLQSNPVMDPNYPASIYNQNISPWTNYAIAGSIWYQGESNRNRAVQYESLLTAMVQDWRQRWDDEFPFYIVQLANFTAPSTEPGTPNAWAELQYSQLNVANKLPKCGIAIINDIGVANDIHPKNKKDVGERLALLALKNDYDMDLKVYSSPMYKSFKVKDDHVLVEFEHVGEGLKSRDGEPLKRFEVAGKDKVWHWAKAEIVGTDMVDLYCEDVKKPVAARYAWAANPEGANLVNSGGLPASLFRTDDWELSTANSFTRRAPVDVAKEMSQKGFKPLFNGKNLDGWKNPYKHGEAKVVGNEVHLTANKKFFMVTEKEYEDFQLIVDIHLPEGQANSGVMFRCHVEPNKVFGYQAECDGSDRRWSGGLYDEGRRKWIWPSKRGNSQKEFLKHLEESKAHFAKPEIKNALKRNDWNRYEITCRGEEIKIKLNGVLITDLKDDVDAKGFIGIQHHGEKGQTYRFRNLFIKELK